MGTIFGDYIGTTIGIHSRSIPPVPTKNQTVVVVVLPVIVAVLLAVVDVVVLAVVLGLVVILVVVLYRCLGIYCHKQFKSPRVLSEDVGVSAREFSTTK